MIKYEGNISYVEGPKGSFSARILFGALKFRLSYDEDDLDGGLYFLGLRIKTLDQIAENTEKRSRNKTDKTEPCAKDNNSKDASNNDSDPADTIADHKADSACDSPEPALKDTLRDYFGKDTRERIKEILLARHKAHMETLRKLWNVSCRTVRKVRDTWVELWKLADKETRKQLIKAIKSISKQLLPRELEGDFKFGLDDPYYTAKVLEVLALLYAKFGDKLRAEPVWDSYCFLGHICFKGRIHLSVIMWSIFKLFISSPFRKIWREYNGK